MAKKPGFKVGQYYAARHNGNNGDLIVGVVVSVRKKGDVILTNLLNDNRSVKRADVLRLRNKRISKAQADELVALFESTQDKAAVRAKAVLLPDFDNEQTELVLPKEVAAPAQPVKRLAQDVVTQLLRIQALLSTLEGELRSLLKGDT